MNVHLVPDEKLTNVVYNRFEKYYKGRNVFIVETPRNGEIIYAEENDRVCFESFLNKRKLVSAIAKVTRGKVDRIFVHNLSRNRSDIAIELKKRYGADIYWIFSGYELYSQLVADGKAELFDYKIEYPREPFIARAKELLFKSSKRAFRQFIEACDYFCFWNYYDYRLLRENYTCKPAFRSFTYVTNDNPMELKERGSRDSKRIMVNHSASPYGNHLTVFDKIFQIDTKGEYDVIAPLSYGDQTVRELSREHGENLFGARFRPLLEFMPLEEYSALLDSVDVAIFGHRRQEGGGNVFLLLAMGKKVFMRNDNNLINHLRDCGYVVFSFEDDLNGVTDLEPLSRKDALHNNRIYNESFSERKISEMYLNLMK